MWFLVLFSIHTIPHHFKSLHLFHIFKIFEIVKILDIWHLELFLYYHRFENYVKRYILSNAFFTKNTNNEWNNVRFHTMCLVQYCSLWYDVQNDASYIVTYHGIMCSIPGPLHTNSKNEESFESSYYALCLHTLYHKFKRLLYLYYTYVIMLMARHWVHVIVS